MPDLTLKEFKGVRSGDLHRRLAEEVRKMSLPPTQAPSESKKKSFTHGLLKLLRPLRKILPRFHPT